MCTADEGRILREVFVRYKDGAPVETTDVQALKSLSRGAFIEFYMSDGRLHARAGRIGSMIKSVGTH